VNREAEEETGKGVSEEKEEGDETAELLFLSFFSLLEL
jgi:hypothetical protein